MNLKPLLGALAALVVLLLGAVLFLGGGSQPPVPPPAAEQGAEPTVASPREGPGPGSGASGPKENLHTAAPGPEPGGMPQGEKDSVLLKIYDASCLPTEESVKIVGGYLFSPDLDVRNAAIEAMKQISTPAASTALRNAASRATSPADKAAFLKAAEFTELPAYVPRSQRPPAGG